MCQSWNWVAPSALLLGQFSARPSQSLSICLSYLNPQDLLCFSVPYIKEAQSEVLQSLLEMGQKLMAFIAWIGPHGGTSNTGNLKGDHCPVIPICSGL